MMMRPGIPKSSSALDSFTKLLLKFNGSNGSTTITDSSPAAHAVTRSGNAQISTSQSKFGGSSIILDGTGDWIDLDGSTDFSFGTGDFTVDFWVRFSAIANFKTLIDWRPTGLNGAYISLMLNASNQWALYVNSSFVINAASTPILNTWQHVALSRASGVTKLFVDGSQVGSNYTDSNNYGVTASRPRIGSDGNSGTFGDLNGFLDEFRISKGIARWTSNFTPPSSEY